MSDDLSLLYTDVEDSLRSSVRELLTRRCPPAAVTAMYDGNRSLVAELWKSLSVELGLAGLLVPESAGGAGASASEVAVVLEELGRAVAPVPFFTSSVLATAVLLDSDGAGAELLGRLADGTVTAALTVPFSLAPGAALPAVQPGLTGRVTSVAGALEADVLLVPVRTGADARTELHQVAVADAVIEPVISLDMSRQLADISFTDARSTVVVTDAGPAIERALQLGAALLASEQVGVAEWCLETTVAYLKDRRQFGRPVGGFQALKHRLADVWAEVENCRAVARYAAATAAAHDPDQAVAGALAQAYCSQAAVHAAEECIQLHAGIGMTWEYPAHLYLKRAKADEIALGTAGAHRATLAGLVDLPPS